MNLPMPKIVITGANGLIGRNLSKELLKKGYQVTGLGRSPGPGSAVQSYAWDPLKNEIDPGALASADYIVHLAGESISRRWTPKRKREIRDSRILSARLLFTTLAEHKIKPKAFITASATGYYGSLTTETEFTETFPPSADFTGETCRLWEAAADPFGAAGIRTVKIRTAVVLSKAGGALPKLELPVRLGLSAALGSGRQYMPWIHIDDLCKILVWAIENPNMEGAYNAVAPEPVTNHEFMRKLARQLNRPLWLPNLPAFLLRLIWGEMAVMLLEGSRVSAEKIQSEGLSFQYPTLDSALKQLYPK